MQNDERSLESSILISEPTPERPETHNPRGTTILSNDRSDRLTLDSFDYIHLHVGNAFQTMRFLCTTYSFDPVAYSGLETGCRDHISYVVEQGNIRIVVTSSLDPANGIGDEVKTHGDAVKEIAFTVSDAAEAFHLALLQGAIRVSDPITSEDEFGQASVATIRAFGDVVHTFVERREYSGVFLPGYKQLRSGNRNRSPWLLDLDHVALSFPTGQLEQMTEFYTQTLSMGVGHEENIVTPNSAMNSRVVQNRSGTVRFPMMEPAASRRTSQIEEFLKYNHGPGIQHLAFSSHDIVGAVRAFQSVGAEFLKTPAAYYDALDARVGSIGQDTTELRDCNILVDRDEWGYLLQIFSKTITARPTLFFELIQRAGARGFGSGNIRALFDAVEREQALRGNL
jgi:4-hydroxyphenylpyruvate dioxygenase